jgi:histidinol-phosphatase (PHP family)
VHGGRFALSDDSHGPDAVGLNYDKMREYILKQGVVDMYYLRRTAIPNHRGRLVEAVKVEGNWASHPFWE